MGKIIIMMLMFVILSSMTFAQTITRTVTPSSVITNGEFTIKYTISSAAGNYGGIIYETLPSGYNLVSFTNNFDVSGKKINGQNIEIVFVGSVNGQYAEMKVLASSISGNLNNGKVEWGAGKDTTSLPSYCLMVNNQGCGTSPSPNNGSGGSSSSFGSIGLIVGIAIGAFILYQIFNKK